MLSGLLGVGGGFLKVPAMHLGMRVPLRVAAATSNFMIGVTAASSLFVYFARGEVQPLLAAPVAIGVAGGSLLGTRIAKTRFHDGHQVRPGRGHVRRGRADDSQGGRTMNVASERRVVERLLQGGMALSTLLFLAGMLAAFSRAA